MPKKAYTTPPAHYPTCLHEACPKASTCLHQMAYAILLKSNDNLNLINPTRCRPDGDCPNYRPHAIQRYARGFKNFRQRMYPDQHHKFVVICMGRFSRNAYYVRRRGDFLLSPKEQAFILNALKRVGVSQEMKFDHYEELPNWYD